MDKFVPVLLFVLNFFFIKFIKIIDIILKYIFSPNYFKHLFCLCFHRHLAGQVAQEWQETEETNKDMRENLLKMTKAIVPYHMDHNAEAEACDLLMEIEKLDLLKNYVDENAYPRVCLYLTR